MSSTFQIIVTHPKQSKPLFVNCLNATSEFLFGSKGTTKITFSNTKTLSNKYIIALLTNTNAKLAMFGDQKLLIEPLAVEAARRNISGLISVYFNDLNVVNVDPQSLNIIDPINRNYNSLAVAYVVANGHSGAIQ